jgi:hypothetical protein
MCRTGHISRKGEVGCAQGAKMPACPFDNGEALENSFSW